MYGGTGTDYLFGGGGNDEMHGGSGNDTLLGGSSVDTLYGGSGSDTFVFAKDQGVDLVGDFEAGADLIGLSESFDGSVQWGNFPEGHDFAGHAYVALDGSIVSILVNFDANNLSADDLTFV